MKMRKIVVALLMAMAGCTDDCEGMMQPGADAPTAAGVEARLIFLATYKDVEHNFGA